MTQAKADIATNKAAIVTINDNIELLAKKTELEAVEKELQDNINAHIKAANAMTYKGGVDGNTNKLPTSNVKVGDTYVVTSAFNGYLPGDLLIAKGDETGIGDAAVITSNLSWDRVVTGYDSYLENKLTAESNVIQLKNYAGNVLPDGEVAFASKEGTITVTTADNTINFEMVWGSF